ncbi:hypothetical protein DFH28DRAFT_1160538 [Melampsora americana]|nr:hypothetical protein DFH28DRAFT_1160538 [Melampsora americana]
MPSTRSGQSRRNPNIASKRPPVPVASKKKKPRSIPSFKRPRCNSKSSDDADSIINDTRSPDPTTTEVTSNPDPTTNNVTSNPDSTQPELLTDGDNELPTLQNYHTDAMMKKWTRSRCKEKLASSGFKGRASTDGRTEIRALIRRFEHLKMLIALALRCSFRTVNTIGGDVASHQDTNAYIHYREFAKRAHSPAMPHPDDPSISQKLGDYNRATGDGWSGLNADQRAVFDHDMLLALAGVPDLTEDDFESEDEENENGDGEIPIPQVTQLTDEEETRYRPIYEELVDHHKVVAKYGSDVPGMSDAKFTRRSLRCIQKYQRNLIADSVRHEFDFWLIASSSVPPIEPGTLTWCKVTTSLPVMTKWVTQKANFPTIFGAVSQGTSLMQAISNATGSHVIKPQPRKNRSDKEKVELGQALVDLLAKAGGRPSMPRGPNPGKTLAARKDRPIRIVQLEGSSLTKEDLEKGFTNMNASGRRRWKKDLDAKLFRFEIISSNQDDNERQGGVALDEGEEPPPVDSGGGSNAEVVSKGVSPEDHRSITED